MFSTFRQLQLGPGQGQVVLQSTASPFDRPIHRISRLACVYCRSKKVKCTGEEHGCRRCLNKQIVCSYTSHNRSRTDTTPRRLPGLRKGAEDADAGRLRSDSRHGTAARHGGHDKPLDVETGLGRDAIMAESSLLNMDFGLGQSDVGYDGHSAYGGSGGLFFDDLQASDATPSSTVASMAADPNVDQLDVDPMPNRAHAHAPPGSDDTAVATSPSPARSLDRTNCLCSEMLEVFETTEVGLAWAQRTTTSSVVNPSGSLMGQGSPSLPAASDEFMCQQEVLRSCEKWLDRDASHIRSQHAVLIISLLDRLLANILSMTETSENVMGDGGDGDDDDDGALAAAVSPDRPQDVLLSTFKAEHSLQIGRWKMNHEERSHVFKSLLSFRTLRLKALLERLGAMAASNRWQMQTVMVQHLLDRLPKHCVLA